MQYALYYYDSCPFCQRVLMAMQSLNVNVEKRNVMKNPEFRQQQIDATKRTTVPCLLIKDCLLYTSPSPRDRTRSRMPSSA